MSNSIILQFSQLTFIFLTVANGPPVQDIELSLKWDEVKREANLFYSDLDYIQAKAKFYELLTLSQRIADSKLSVISPYVLLAPWIGIARCEVKLGKNKEAITAFRKGIGYDPIHHELYAGNIVLAEYALHLANTNNLNEAKITYYLAMSRLKSSTTKTEPMPFTIVFDSDPKAEVWTFNKENLVKACEGLLVLASGDNGQQLAKKYPDWPFAQMLSSMRQSKVKGEKFTPENDPNIMRKNLQVLIKANEDLKTDWPKICEKYIDPFNN